MDEWMKEKENKIWSGFLTNLLGVILGILLTFGGNALWQQREEKQRTKEVLILVRNELKTNKQWFKNQEKVMRKDCYVYKKILECKSDWTSLPQDTINEYMYRTMYMEFNQLTTSAWQILQNSEMIQKMPNKELVIRLTDCYFWINKIQEILEEYWKNKEKAVAPELDPYKYFDAVMNNKESVFFYNLMSSETLLNWNLFPLIDAIVDYTVSLLDKYGDFRYDMEEKDKEIESFIEARMDSVLQQKDTIRNRTIENK